MPTPGKERKPILAGDLSEFSVQSLMSAFSLGRQVVTIEVLDARGACDGRIVMKGGRVLSANAAGRSGVEAVQHLLASAVPAKFRVVREVSDVFARAPHLGTLAEVTGAAGQAARKAPSLVSRAAHARTRVMEGTLADFDLATILQVVSTARQHTVMEVLDLRGQRAGSVQLKAGKILRAEAGLLTGVAAVQRLLTAPTSFRFIVYRALDPDGELPLLGAVDEVLMRAATEAPPAPPRRSGIHLAPTPLASGGPVQPPDAALDPDEIETLIPVSSARADDDGPELDDSIDELDQLDELEDEVTRVSGRALMPAPAPQATEPVAVLDGRLSDFDLGSVLQVAGLSRQPTLVRIFDDQREPVGEVRVQGGQLLTAQAQGQPGHHALRFLLHSPRDFHFSVLRLPHRPELMLAPLGTVSELLQLASERPPEPAEELGPHFRTQAPSLPAGAHAAQTWKRALGVGLLLGAAVGVVATVRLGREATPAETGPVGARSAMPSVEQHAAQASHAERAPRNSTPPAPRPALAPVSPAPVAPEVRPIVSVSSVSTPVAGRSRAEVASIQGALRMLGFGPGPIDGVAGPITRAAIAAFQRKEGLPSDGELSPATEQRLQARIRPHGDAAPGDR